MRQNFNLLCAILNQNMFVPFCVLFRCLLALVRKTKLKERRVKKDSNAKGIPSYSSYRNWSRKARNHFKLSYFSSLRTILDRYLSLIHTNITLSQNHIKFTADNNSAWFPGFHKNVYCAIFRRVPICL